MKGWGGNFNEHLKKMRADYVAPPANEAKAA
jgi:hypothetical protein